MRWTRLQRSSAIFAFIIGLLCIAALAVLNIGNTPEASADWRHTTKALNFLLPLAIFCELLVLLVLKLYKPGRHYYMVIIFLAAGIACLLLPRHFPGYFALSWQAQYLLSFLWGTGFLLPGIACLMLARGPAWLTWIFCSLGSILIALGAGEYFLLATQQAPDGIQSAYSYRETDASGAEAEIHQLAINECGVGPMIKGRPYSYRHHATKFDEPVYDVQYGINQHGHRAAPEGRPDADCSLLIFGCSFAFGYGLENEQTWVWQLARLLGNNWQLENYAQNSYGAGQMLCLLEHNLILPQTAQKRFALFLAIEDHLRRNEIIYGMPHYSLGRDGIPQEGGQPRFGWLNSLPLRMNGSQLARTISAGAVHSLTKVYPEYTGLYLAMLARSAKLLREKHATRLIVLLWPDIEYLKPALEKLDIPVLSAADAFPDWNRDFGASYAIAPFYDMHPNLRATSRLAAWLAAYLEKQSGRQSPPHSQLIMFPDNPIAKTSSQRNRLALYGIPS